MKLALGWLGRYTRSGVEHTVKTVCARDAVEQLEVRMDRLEALLPGPGEAMSSIQTHFAKLYFAGKAKSWGLATFELDEIQENLETVVELRPEENGVNLRGVADAFEETQVKALAAVVRNRDTARFGRAYQEAVSVCNGCHEATNRAYITITVPQAPPVPNQQWAPPSGSR